MRAIAMRDYLGGKPLTLIGWHLLELPHVTFWMPAVNHRGITDLPREFIRLGEYAMTQVS
jgi:hypothetical protein